MADTVETGAITKNGVVWFEMSISRTRSGVKFWFKANPLVEELMRNLAEGAEHVVLSTYGGVWVTKDNTKAAFHGVQRDLDSPYYTINSLGAKFSINAYDESGLGRHVRTNLSFLRFVGISEPDGREFEIIGPMNRDTIRGLKDSLLVAARQLIRDYLAPVSINLKVVGSEG